LKVFHKFQNPKLDGEYTFQVVLNKNGDISFNYRNIPNLSISNISHTVKIGISDAYIYFKVLSNGKSTNNTIHNIIIIILIIIYYLS